MLSSLKKLFSREVDYHVETYGKLPCYKDYISVITTAGAAQWRSWLLDSFQGKIMPPEGVWPFIYQHKKNSDLVVGVIKASSDGLRQFPFTLFVVCSKGSHKGGLCSRPLAHSIWKELQDLHQQLIAAEDIQAFYARFYGKRISPSAEKNGIATNDQEFSCNRDGEWPQMLVAEKCDAKILHLVRDGKTSNEEFAQNWQRLITIDPSVTQPICNLDSRTASTENSLVDESEEGRPKESQGGKNIRPTEHMDKTDTQ